MTSKEEANVDMKSVDEQKLPLTDLQARVLLVNGWFEHPNKDRMDKVREILSSAAEQIEEVFASEPNNKLHQGCAIDTMKLIQDAKNKGCDAFLVNYACTDKRASKKRKLRTPASAAAATEAEQQHLAKFARPAPVV